MARLKTKIKRIKVIFYNGVDLACDREDLGLSQTEFASKAGWSQSKQTRLEMVGVHRLDLETAVGFVAAGIDLDLDAVNAIDLALGES